MRRKQNNELPPETSGYFARLGKDLSKNKSIYLLAVLPLAWVIIFSYMPMYGILVAFQNYSPRLGIWGSDWVGLKNFARFINDPYFLRDIKNTFVISITSIVVNFPLPIIFALLLNEIEKKKFLKVVQTITYVPHFVSLVVICGMIKTFVSGDGMITALVSSITGKEIGESLLMNSANFVPIYVLSDTWQGIGWSSIIFMAAIAGVDESLYEASAIDGAGRFKQVIYVTIPSILPTIIIMFILRMGTIINVGVDKIMLLYNELNAETSETLSYYIYKKGIGQGEFGLSTAAGLFNSVVNLIFVVVTNKCSSMLSETSLW